MIPPRRLRLLEQSAERRSPARGASLRDHRLHCATRWCWPSVPNRCCCRSRPGSDLLSGDRRTMDRRLDSRGTANSLGMPGRMRGSLHGRLLVEMALVRIARLETLTDAGVRSSSGWPRSSRESTRAEKADLAVKKRNPSRRPAVADCPPETAAYGPPSERLSIAGGIRVTPTPARRRRSRLSPARPANPPAAGPRAVRRGFRARRPATAVAARVLLQATPAFRSRQREPATPSAAARCVATGTCDSHERSGPTCSRRLAQRSAWRLSQVEPVAVIGPDMLVIAANRGIQFRC